MCKKPLAKWWNSYVTKQQKHQQDNFRHDLQKKAGLFPDIWITVHMSDSSLSKTKCQFCDINLHEAKTNKHNIHEGWLIKAVVIIVSVVS